METLLALLTGGLFAVSVFLLMRRHMLRIVFGLILLTSTINLAVLTLGRVARVAPPIIAQGKTAPTGPIANPLPQALVLTSIVISLGVIAFMLLLVYRIEKTSHTADVDALRRPDAPDRPGISE